MYMKTFGFTLTVCIIASFIGQVGFDLFSNIWLSLWSEDMSAVGPNATVDTDLANLRVGVYGGIGGAQSKYPKGDWNTDQAALCEKVGKALLESQSSQILLINIGINSYKIMGWHTILLNWKSDCAPKIQRSEIYVLTFYKSLRIYDYRGFAKNCNSL